MNKSKRTLNGYVLVYEPNHPSAMTSENWSGYVYEHRLVAENTIGRLLNENEEVHHLDLNRANNCPSNLLILEKSQHMKLHVWISSNKNLLNAILDTQENETRYCVCGTVLYKNQKNFCSLKCSKANQRKVERPSKESLLEDLSTMSYTAVGKKYGVSDNAIRKWIKAN